MVESIKIRNLGPVKDVYIDDIKPLTVFIGESGSGKSTIMKVIALFRWINKMENIQSYLKSSNFTKTFKFTMPVYWKSCGLEQFVNKDTEIVYTINFDSGNSHSILFSNYNLRATKGIDFIKPEDIYFKKISFISETRNMIPMWAANGTVFPGTNLGFYFNEVYRDFEIASAIVMEVAIDFLNIKFANRQTNAGKKYSIESLSDKPYQIDFKNSSSGTQNSVPISLITQYYSKYFSFEEAFNRSVLSYLANTDKLTDFKPVKNLGDINKKIYIHIEEPELSLYPEAQCLLINDIVNKCFINTLNDVELMFSTHSPYIINHLNLLVRAFEKEKLDRTYYNFDDLAVYLVEDGKLESLMAVNEKLVDTNPLSETINNIYEEYNSL